MCQESKNLKKLDTLMDCSETNDQWNETILQLVSFMMKHKKYHLICNFQVSTAKNSRNKRTQSEAVRNIRKITSENENLIDLLIHHKAIPVLVEKCKERNFETQLQALWALSNITSGTSEQTGMVNK